MTDKKKVLGHIIAIITVIVWGTTFISTKVLLEDFKPVEILFFRIFIAYIMLIIVKPKKLKTRGLKEELLFIGAGICGITLYFLFENIALQLSLASNVGVLVSVAPFVTAILAHFFLNGESLRINFFIGFLVAIIGIILVGYNGNVVLKLNPLGDFLAIMAAIVWAVYSILLSKIGKLKYNPILCNRRIFLYGLLSMSITFPFFNFTLGLERFKDTSNLLNIIYLGVGASAICFVIWNIASNILGAVKLNAYIYIIPAITMIASAIILHEPITKLAILGTGFILAGLILSESKFKIKKK